MIHSLQIALTVPFVAATPNSFSSQRAYSMMSMEQQFKDKVIAITGAASGIGLTTA